VGDEGLEPVFQTPDTITTCGDECHSDGAKSGAVGGKSGPTDADLVAVNDAWPKLPDTVRYQIIAIVRATTGG
jgi:hypothetical protein